MITDEKFETLMNEITKQEAVIEAYAEKLETAGNIDPSIEDYLNNARDELRQRKVKLLEEFQPKTDKTGTKIEKNPLAISIEEGEFSPKVKVKCTTPNSSQSRAEKFPFYSVHKIEADKPVNHAKEIFKTGQASPRQNSPSASRYAQNVSSLPQNINQRRGITNTENRIPRLNNSPSTYTKTDSKNITRTGSNNLDGKNYSNEIKVGSGELTVNCKDINNSALSLKDLIDKDDSKSVERYLRYLEEREKKLQAREKMVELRERIVAEKETEILRMVRFNDRNNFTIDLRISDQFNIKSNKVLQNHDKKSNEADSDWNFSISKSKEIQKGSNTHKLKPPKSPDKVVKKVSDQQSLFKGNKKIVIFIQNDLVYSIPGMQQSNITDLENLFNKKPAIRHRKNSLSH